MSLALAERAPSRFSYDGFELPSGLRATAPAEIRGAGRSDVRLMVVEDRRLTHHRFAELADLLRAGDLLVVNASATIPASLPAWESDGTDLVINLSTEHAGSFWVVEPREPAGPASKPLADHTRSRTVALPNGGAALLLAPYPAGTHHRRLWIAELQLPEPVPDFALRHGEPIRYAHVDRCWPLEAYQTVFGSVPGSAEMPSAARPFTDRLVVHLLSRNVRVAPIVLHTGVSSQEKPEPPYAERFEVPVPTAELVNATRASGARVIAVGTTVVRALESAVDGGGTVHPAQGWTELVITPDRGVRVVDGLLTGWHEPGSSHLDLLASVGGERSIAESYDSALRAGYLWHEFGDSHLILAPRSPR